MKKILIIFLAVSVLCLCGCSVSVESLLAPPKLSEEQAAIYNALTLSKGGDVHLKYPVSGRYRSAFVVENIDEEETDEAIVFYEASNMTDGGSSLRLNFLDKKDGQWVSVYDFAALGSEIERVMFSDLGDGEVSIIITYTIQNSSDSATSIFKYSDNTPAEIYKSRHSYMNLTDINGDDVNEVLMINRDRASETASVSILGFTEEKTFTILSSSALTDGFSECKNITMGQCDAFGSKGIFIDYALTDGTMSTDVFICYDRRLIPVKADLSSLVRKINTYTPTLYSQDIDGDGVIEIPVSSPFAGYENAARPEQLNTTCWYRLTDGGYGAELQYSTYISIRNDYVFFIPSRWQGLVTANASIGDGTVTFSRYDSRTKETGEELMVIKAVTEAALEKSDLSGCTQYGKSADTGYSFFIKNNTESSFALTEAELSDLFRVMDKGENSK